MIFYIYNLAGSIISLYNFIFLFKTVTHTYFYFLYKIFSPFFLKSIVLKNSYTHMEIRFLQPVTEQACFCGSPCSYDGINELAKYIAETAYRAFKGAEASTGFSMGYQTYCFSFYDHENVRGSHQQWKSPSFANTKQTTNIIATKDLSNSIEFEASVN